MKRNPLIIAIAAAAFSGASFAAGMGADSSATMESSDSEVTAGAEGFGHLDTDQDGRISREEAEKDPRLSSQIDKLDSDGDGMLDESEFSVMEGRLPSEAAPAGKPETQGGVEDPAAQPGSDTPPGLSTEPGASEAAPGRNM